MGTDRGLAGVPVGTKENMTALASVLAVLLVVVGIVGLAQGQVLLAIVLFVGAAVVGPGGNSIFTRRT